MTKSPSLGRETLYMTTEMRETLKKRAPNRRAKLRRAGLDGAS
jgi:hypothetical protein